MDKQGEVSPQNNLQTAKNDQKQDLAGTSTATANTEEEKKSEVASCSEETKDDIILTALKETEGNLSSKELSDEEMHLNYSDEVMNEVDKELNNKVLEPSNPSKTESTSDVAMETLVEKGDNKKAHTEIQNLSSFLEQELVDTLDDLDTLNITKEEEEKLLLESPLELKECEKIIEITNTECPIIGNVVALPAVSTIQSSDELSRVPKPISIEKDKDMLEESQVQNTDNIFQIETTMINPENSQIGSVMAANKAVTASPEESASFPVSSSEASMEHDVIAISSVKDNETPNVKIFLESKDVSNKSHDTPTIPESHQPNATEVFTASSAENDTDNTLFDEVKHTSLEDTNQEISSNDKVITDCPSTFANKDRGLIEYSAKTASLPPILIKGNIDSVVSEKQNIDQAPSNTFLITADTKNTEPTSSSVNEGIIELNNTETYDFTSNESIIEPMSIEVLNTVPVPLTSNEGMLEAISEEANETEPALLKSNKITLNTMSIEVKNTESVPSTSNKGTKETLFVKAQNTEPVSSTFNEEILQVITVESNKTEVASSTSNEGSIEPISLEVNNTQCVYLTSNESIIEPMLVEVDNTKTVPITSNVAMSDPISEESNKNELASSTSNEESIEPILVDITKSATQISNESMTEPMLVEGDNTETDHSTSKVTIFNPISEETNKTELASLSSNEGSGEGISVELNNTEQKVMPSGTKTTKTFPTTSNEGIDSLSVKTNIAESVPSTLNEGNNASDLKEATEPAPLTSKEENIGLFILEGTVEAVPSVSAEDTKVQDVTDDAQEITDSLSLLAESSERSMEDEPVPSTSKKDNVGQLALEETVEAVPLTSAENMTAPDVVDEAQEITALLAEPSQSIMEDEAVVKTNISECVPSTLNEGNNASDLQDATVPVPSTSNKNNIGHTVLEGTVETVPSTSAEDTTALDNIDKGLKISDSLGLLAEPSEKSMEDEPVPSTSKQENIGQLVLEGTVEAVPSTSADDSPALDVMDEAFEITDSLGLLAESSGRSMEEDEDPEPEDEEDIENEEDDDDYDPEDESAQPSPDMSDDSNTQNSEVNTNYVAKQISDEIELQSDNVFDSLINVDSEDKDMKLKYDLESEGDVSEAADKESDANKSTPIKPASTTIGEDKTSANVNDDNDVKVIPDGKDKKEPEKKDESILLGLLISSDEEKSDSADNIAKKDGKTKKRKKCEDDAGHIRHVMDVVHIEENSSSEDDIQIVKKDESSTKSVVVTAANSSVQGTDKEQASKKSDMPKETPAKAKSGLEVFSLDSDEEEKVVVPSSAKPSSLKPSVATSNATQPSPPGRCINPLCRSDVRTARFVPANASAVNFFDAKKRKRPTVCENCSESLMERTLGLLEGVSSMRPLFELKMERVCADLVEISDSDTDSPDDEADEKAAEKVGVDGQRVLEEQLVDLLNSSWRRLKLDERMSVAKSEINDYLEVLEKECLEVDTMLSECQVATDELRRQLYATFASETRTLPAVQIYDTPYAHYSTREADVDVNTQIRRSKRVRSIQMDDDSASKRLAVQTNKADQMLTVETESVGNKTDLDDDNTDLCVVNHSSESPPEGLPAVGTLTKTPVTANMKVYAMRNSFGTWVPATVLDTQPRQATSSNNQYTVCRVKFDHKKDPKNAVKQLSARHLAYQGPCDVRMTIGTRIIALFKDVSNASKQGSFFSGVVAENPSPVNNYRYLVFFDDGYAQYVSHPDTRVVCECSPLVWEEVHPHSREFVHAYLNAYPERPMVRLHTGQKFKTERNGKFCDSVVTGVDASLVRVQFGSDGREEWIYRGSTRLEPLFTEVQAAGRHRQGSARQRSKATRMPNMPYVEYTRSDDLETNKQVAQQQIEELKRQRSVAKKSTAWSQLPPPRAPQRNVDSHMSRVVYYTPKAPLTPHKMVPHTCGPQCRRSDVVPLHDLRNYNPLARPLLSGWERQIVRFKLRKEVMYRAPCGRRLRDMAEIHKYLQTIGSEMGVDLFDINPNTHCLAEFILNRCIVSKKDLSHGKENVPVPCVNYYDNALPEFCSYNTVRTPTAGVPLNLDPDFLCGCDCTDDCQDKSKCACWKMTLDGARTIGMNGDLGYVYKRLLDPVPSGIYECNSRCKCKATCLNRVAQHPLQLKLQVFKTVDRGWGIRALNDVPKGGFLCIYAGNLLTDATANLDGLNEGDEYLAELDYIEVVEQMKEGYEEDVPKKDKELDRRNSKQSEEESSSEQSEEETSNRDENEDDDDFKPAYDVPGGMQFNKRLRKREKRKKDKEEAEVVVKEKVQKVAEDDDDCITISDDEEVREPSTFTAQAGMEDKSFVSKHSSVRALYGKDEACYIVDAKVQGNIGRYLNHSCQPNVFVQNVFVDTHDPRFPWVAFFALSHIKAGTELTWNYNYDVGSVPGKVLHCYCGAPNCRKRLL